MADSRRLWKRVLLNNGAPVSKEIKRYDAENEQIAVSVVWPYEEALCATVTDVSTAEFAVAAGLSEYPGFDLLVHRPDGKKLCLEVKGCARIGEIELSENEWVKACNHRDGHWLYVMYDCATAYPRLLRVQALLGKLLVKALCGVKTQKPKYLLLRRVTRMRWNDGLEGIAKCIAEESASPLRVVAQCRERCRLQAAYNTSIADKNREMGKI